MVVHPPKMKSQCGTKQHSTPLIEKITEIFLSIFICFANKKESHTSLKRHDESEQIF